MTLSTLHQYLQAYVPAFQSPVILAEGHGFHATPFRRAIERSGKLLGAFITPELHQTQKSAERLPAVHDPGVIYAYGTEKMCRWEGHGPGMDIIRIRFRGAISAWQREESLRRQQMSLRQGIAFPDEPTILILTSDVVDFVFL